MMSAGKMQVNDLDEVEHLGPLTQDTLSSEHVIGFTADSLQPLKISNDDLTCSCCFAAFRTLLWDGFPWMRIFSFVSVW